MRNAYLLVFLLLICRLSLAQDNIPDLPTFPSPCDNNSLFPAFRNPSFEGAGICIGPPIPWNNCGVSDNGAEPFPIASRGACLGLNIDASDRDTYLIFTSNQEDNQQSGTGIFINPALAANQDYAFLIDLRKVEEDACMTFEVYGSNGCADNEELLWQSEEIQNTGDWQSYLVAFTPTNNYRYITLRATSTCGEGRLLADNIRAYGNDPNFEPIIQATNTQACGAGDFVFTNPVENARYRWERNGVEVAETNEHFLEIDQAGNYTVTLLTDCGDFQSDAITIEAGNPPLAPTIIGDGVLCGDGELISLFAQNPDPNTTYEWYLEGEAAIQGEGTEFNPLLPGFYSVQATNGCGSSTSDAFEVVEGPSPATPVISGGAELCLGETATLTVENEENGVTYFWFAIGVPDAIAEGPVFITDEGGVFYVVADNACKTARSNNEFVVNIPEAICNGTGEDCSDVLVSELPFYDQPARGFFETARAASDFTGEDACEPDYFQGKEFVFSYVPEQNQCINVQLGNPEKQPLALLVTQQCEPFRECIATSLSEGGNNSQINGLQLNAGELYYFVVGTSLPGENVPFLFLMEECVSSEECPEGEVAVPTWENPGLEDTPEEDRAPIGWEESGIRSVFTPVSPDIQPISIAQAASEGNSYVGITAFPGGTNDDYQEGIAQELGEPLLAGTEYAFSVDLANPALEPGDFRGCGGIEIWAGNAVNDFAELLWTSPAIADNTDWQSFTVNFTPTADYTHIQILAALYPGCNRDYVLVDNFVEIVTDIEPPEIEATTDIICPGEFPVLSIEEVDGATYQWFLNEAPIGTNTNTIEAQAPGEYKVSVIVQCNTVESEPITIDEAAIPEEPVISGNEFICNGAPTMLTIENLMGNNDPSFTYAWYLNGVELGIAGTELEANQPGTYTVGVRYACGEIISEAFELDFAPETQTPNITGQTVFCDTGSGEIRLTNPQAGVTYQWFFEETEIAGANGTRIEITGEGSYYLEATGICSTQQSEEFIVEAAFDPNVPELAIEDVDCDSPFRRLNVTNAQEDLTYIWVLNGTDTVQESSAPFLETNLLGEYQVIASNNCLGTVSESVTLEDTNNESPVPIISGVAVICEGTTGTLTIDNFDVIYEYQWLKDGQPIEGANLKDLVVSEEANYSVRQFDGCEEKLSEGILVRVTNESLVVGIAGPNSVCEGQSIILDASGVPMDMLPIWYRNEEEDPVGQGFQFEVSEEGAYYFIVNTTCQTFTSSTKEITVTPTFAQLRVTGDNDFCEGESIVISIENTGEISEAEITWFKEGDPTVLGRDFSLEVTEAGNYYVEVTDDCKNQQSELFEVQLSELPEIPEIAGENQICQESSTLLSIVPQENTAYTWTLDGVDLGKNTPEISADAPGSYQVEISNACGSVLSEVFVLEEVSIEATISSDTTIEAGSSVQLFADGGAEYNWSPAASLDNPMVNNPIASPEVSTTYSVVVTSVQGCEEERTVTVNVIPPSGTEALSIPNVFSPNNDGFNDFWEIAGVSFANPIEVTVFDRWGAKVFYSAEYQEPWDGTLDGRNLPVGTYFYVIQPKGNEETKPITGHVSILK